MAGFAHRAARALLPLLERAADESWMNLPLPPVRPTIVHGPGPTPDRVLWIANGFASGWGVTTHDLGAAGCTARAVAGITGRGIDIDVRALHSGGIDSVAAALTPIELERCDAVVLALGSREAFAGMPAREWRRHLTATIDAIRSASSRPAIVVTGIDEVLPIPVPGVPARLAVQHVRDLSRATREIAATRPDVVLVESPLVSDSATGMEFVAEQAVAFHRDLAAELAHHLALALEAGDHPPRALDERLRAAEAEAVLGRGLEDDPRLVQLVDTARQLLGAADTFLVLVGADRVWPLVRDALGNGPRARAGSLSALALDSRGALIIPDTTADPRVADLPIVRGAPYYRSYAGQVILSPTGHAVGVLGVIDDKPSALTASDLTLLRALAQRASAILFG